jgi:hypothetical protein
LINISRFFKIREIRNRAGELHFQRYRLLETPWFNIYIHYIAKSDQDKDPHNHPWNFWSIILFGAYSERRYASFDNTREYINPNLTSWYKSRRTILSYSNCSISQFHKIKLAKPTWTLVFTGKRISNNWGYLTKEGFVNHEEYRKLRHSDNL